MIEIQIKSGEVYNEGGGEVQGLYETHNAVLTVLKYLIPCFVYFVFHNTDSNMFARYFLGEGFTEDHLYIMGETLP